MDLASREIRNLTNATGGRLPAELVAGRTDDCLQLRP